MSKTYRFLLRMPEDLRDRLKAAAQDKGSSLNSEIVDRLEDSLASVGIEGSRSKGEIRMKQRTIWVAVAGLVLVTATALVAGRASRTASGTDLAAFAAYSSEALGARAKAEAAPWRGGHGTESGEAEHSGAAALDYENRAYPQDAISFDQTEAAIAAGERIAGKGAKAPRKWQQVGSGTVDIDRLGTQHFLRPTQWAGRVSAMAVDYNRCDSSYCRLYVAAAGGGIWRTDDALGDKPPWKELNKGLDSLSIGALLIDPTDSKSNTLYVGTGEPNGASENEAGVGLYKSTNAGKDWDLVPGSVAVAKDRGIGAVAVDKSNPQHLFIGTAVARHGFSATSGGRFTPPNAPKVGLYESTDGGATFNLVLSRPSDTPNPNTPNGSDFFKGGISHFEWDPNNGSVFYVTMFDYGVFRGTIGPGGALSFEQIYTATPDPAGLGIRYELATADLGTKTRIYLGEGSNEVGPRPFTDASKLFRTDDAAATHANADWIKLSSNVDGTPGFSSWDYCRTQCSYDMPVVSPPGRPDEVWIGGVTQYQELPTRTPFYRSNGRAVMRSLNAGVQFTDMSGDARHDWEAVHPDLHAFAFGPDNVTFIGSDGGVTRTDGTYVDFSSDCDNRNNLQSRPVDYADCKTWLSSIPRRLITMNANLPTMQLQDLAVDQTDPKRDLITGTQDNGSPFFDGSDWSMNVQGDGGPPAIDSAGVIHYHQYSGPFADANFEGTTSGKWLWISDPFAFSPEGAAIFYGAMIADPNVSRTAFYGMQHVWRTKKAGGDQAFLEAHCDTNTGDAAFTGPNSGCGDWKPLGGADNVADAGNLSAGPDADKGGGAAGYVVSLARAQSDNSTLWAGTRRGRLWISKNADAEPTTAVTWKRLDTPAQPRRFISGISVDPTDPNHAFVSFSGFVAYTPAQPGHVFDVRYNPGTGTATWTDLTYDLGDQPILDVQYDGPTGDLFVATDFGVDRLAAGDTSWFPAADGLPKTAVYALTLALHPNESERILYAATHGRAAWSSILPKVKKQK
jgi:hypothetical protein